MLFALLGERAYEIWVSRKESADFKSIVNSLVEEQVPLRKDVGLFRESLKAISEEIKELPFRLKTATESLKESPNEEYAKLSSSTSKLVSVVEQLPHRVKQEIVKELDFRDQAREEEEAKRKSQAVCNELKTQTEGLRGRFPIIDIASSTRELLSSLKTQMKDWEVLAKNYAEYLKLDKQWEELNNLQSKLSEHPHMVQSELPEQLNKRIREIESLGHALTKNHRTVWFTALLDEASRFPSEQEKTLRLKGLLNLEEISLSPGQEIKNPRDVDVIGVEGTGDRTIVKEILQKGYQERTSGLVLKKPKVTVRLD
ncbi:MAG TPA: hypothetical protein VJ044_06575 [Candidatus Hodarchaeales archaeon]|nr:hypothetical protein [Candidatus Hodarchaeales archaeon]